MKQAKPDPKLKFTFGLWTVGNIGRDPFGLPTRAVITPVEICRLLGEVGAYGVNFHDNDLVPIDATASERDGIVKEFRAAMSDNGLVCPMATTNLFHDIDALKATSNTRVKKQFQCLAKRYERASPERAERRCGAHIGGAR